jgi:hypothetical protein
MDGSSPSKSLVLWPATRPHSIIMSGWCLGFLPFLTSEPIYEMISSGRLRYSRAHLKLKKNHFVRGHRRQDDVGPLKISTPLCDLRRRVSTSLSYSHSTLHFLQSDGRAWHAIKAANNQDIHDLFWIMTMMICDDFHNFHRFWSSGWARDKVDYDLELELIIRDQFEFQYWYDLDFTDQFLAAST